MFSACSPPYRQVQLCGVRQSNTEDMFVQMRQSIIKCLWRKKFKMNLEQHRIFCEFLRNNLWAMLNTYDALKSSKWIFSWFTGTDNLRDVINTTNYILNASITYWRKMKLQRNGRVKWQRNGWVVAYKPKLVIKKPNVYAHRLVSWYLAYTRACNIGNG